MIQVQFDRGIEADTYLSELKFYRSVVRKLVEVAVAEEDHIAELRSALQGFPQPVRAIAMTEDWCGDSACNLPILAKLFSGADVPFLVFHGSEYEELEKYYNDRGIDHIPVISLWDGNGEEIGHWVEQPATVLKMKDEWKAARPEFMELYAKRESDKDAGKKFAVLYRQFLEEMSDWYVNGMWKETTREIVEIAK